MFRAVQSHTFALQKSHLLRSLNTAAAAMDCMSSLSSVLRKHAAPLKANADSIRFAETPTEFYDELLNGINSAKSHIMLASLYLGSGKLECDLVDAMHAACERNPDLKVTVVFDYLRGTRVESRGKPQPVSSVTMLAPLLRDFPERVQLRLFHIPMHTFWKRLLPMRVIEGVGVFHSKMYIMDDKVILSGANLSDTYFTNRQDRYCIVDDTAANFSTWCRRYVATVGGLSYAISPERLDFSSCKSVEEYRQAQRDAMKSPSVHLASETSANAVDTDENGELCVSPLLLEGTALKSTGSELPIDPIEHSKRFSAIANRVLRSLYDPSTSTPATISDGEALLFPLLQMKQVGIRSEELALMDAIRSFSASSAVKSYVCSAYFNIPKTLAKAFLHSQTAHGWTGSQGMSRFIPGLYAYYAHRFWVQSRKSWTKNGGSDIEFAVYERPGWSFHGKGFWWMQQNSTESVESQRAVGTIVGSSNYGHRSVRRDFELDFAILTDNNELQKRMADELHGVFGQNVRVVASNNATALPNDQSVRRGGLTLRTTANVLDSYL